MLGFVDKRDSQINWRLISKPHLLSRGDLQQVGITVAWRQGGGTGPRTRRADTYARRHVRSAETVRQWRASLSRSSRPRPDGPVW